MMNYHETYNSFYNSVEWKKLRDYKFAEANGLCEECLASGKITAGKEIHHIFPIDTAVGWTRRYDITNLKCLCPDCHNKIHERTSPLQKFNEYWEGLNAESTVNKP